MDNLNLLKLINSLFDFVSKNKPPANKEEKQEKSQEQKIEREEENIPQKDFLPLQADMLKTMTSHEEFVKRVMNNNKR